MPARPAVHRPPLRVIESDVHDSAWFCGHCGEHHHATPSVPMARVCPACGLGLLLQTRADTAPGPGDAFMVVDSALTVQAVSARAEQVLGVIEHQVVNRHLTELLIPGEAEPILDGSVAGAITRAACGLGGQPRRFTVRPSQTFGVRMVARITACGPPPAALLVLDPPAGAG